MRMPLSELLKPYPAERKDQPCPVSAGGRCLLDLLDTGTSKADDSLERYTPRQLRLLRRFATLVRTGNPKVVRAVEILVGEVLEGAE